MTCVAFPLDRWPWLHPEAAALDLVEGAALGTTERARRLVAWQAAIRSDLIGRVGEAEARRALAAWTGTVLDHEERLRCSAVASVGSAGTVRPLAPAALRGVVSRPPVHLSPSQAIAIQALRRVSGGHRLVPVAEWRQAFDDMRRHASQQPNAMCQSFNRARRRLLELRLIEVQGKHVRIRPGVF